MILYHFTELYNLDHPEDGRTILKEGLKPNGKKGMPALDAVWFTTEADPEFMFAGDEGKLNPDWKKDCARIKVVIPSTDDRLMKWETWLRQPDERADREAIQGTRSRIYNPSSYVRRWR
jgi:hypothetical protein